MCGSSGCALLLFPGLDDRVELINVSLESAELLLRGLTGRNDSHQRLELWIRCSSRSKHLNDWIGARLRRPARLAVLRWPLP
jgi:hypothetical protein